MVWSPPTHREADSFFKLPPPFAVELNHRGEKKPRNSPQEPWQWRDCTQCLEHIELRRNDEVYLNALGAERLPDPTTEGDFCRRFTEPDVVTLLDAINQTRLRVWSQ